MVTNNLTKISMEYNSYGDQSAEVSDSFGVPLPRDSESDIGVTDLRTIFDSVRLDGRIDDSHVDKLASKMEEALRTSNFSDSAFQELARKLLHTNISERQENPIGLVNMSSGILTPTRDESRLHPSEDGEQSRYDMTTQSADSTARSSFASTNCPTASHAPHSRGRSPSRSRGLNMPRTKNRSSTPKGRTPRPTSERNTDATSESHCKSQSHHTPSSLFQRSIAPVSPAETVLFSLRENLAAPVTHRTLSEHVHIASGFRTPSSAGQTISTSGAHETLRPGSIESHTNTRGSISHDYCPNSSVEGLKAPSLNRASTGETTLPSPLGSLENLRFSVGTYSSPLSFSTGNGETKNRSSPICQDSSRLVTNACTGFRIGQMGDTTPLSRKTATSDSQDSRNRERPSSLGPFDDCSNPVLRVGVICENRLSPSAPAASDSSSQPTVEVDRAPTIPSQGSGGAVRDEEKVHQSLMRNSENLEDDEISNIPPRNVVSMATKFPQKAVLDVHSPTQLEAGPAKKTCQAPTPNITDPSLLLQFNVDLSSRAKQSKIKNRPKRTTQAQPGIPFADHLFGHLGSSVSSSQTVAAEQRSRSQASPVSSPMDIDSDVDSFKFTIGKQSPKPKNPRRHTIRLGRLSFQQQVGTSRPGCAEGNENASLNKFRTTKEAVSASLTNSWVGIRSHFSFGSQGIPQSFVGYTGKNDMVIALRESARSSYIAAEYKTSIIQNTKAAKICRAHDMNEKMSGLLAILLSNRAAGLLMVGAYQAAVEDCREALQVLPAVSSGNGTYLRPKLYTRLGRSHLKLGEAEASIGAFDRAIEAVDESISCLTMKDGVDAEEDRKGFSNIRTEASLGKTDAVRFRDAMDSLAALRQSTPLNRKLTTEMLRLVEKCLSIASGSEFLQEKFVGLLANLKRWREVGSNCERFARNNVKLDGVFTEDIAERNPFAGVSTATSLKPTFTDCQDGNEANSAEPKLCANGVAEAVLRIPHSLSPFYIRALRLEERHAAAEAASNSLQHHVSERSGDYDDARLRTKFAWLSMEIEKVKKTKLHRGKGDVSFAQGDFELAFAQYGYCLAIDAEGTRDYDVDGSTAGGRLHAVLHCNRAACLMALHRYQEALVQCTYAIRIHSHYMKALQRRARCYAKLARFDEAINEYQSWIEMVASARRTALHDNAQPANLFDGPRDVSDETIAQAQKELDDVRQNKNRLDARLRAERCHQQQQRNHSQDYFSNSSRQGDAQRRRDYFYSSKSHGSRRWDSFTDRGQKRSSRSNFKAARGEEKKSSKAYTADSHGVATGTGGIDHYRALNVQPTATDEEIKKAYKKVSSYQSPLIAISVIFNAVFSH